MKTSWRDHIWFQARAHEKVNTSMVSIAKAPQTPRNPEFMVVGQAPKWATVDHTNHLPHLSWSSKSSQVLGFLHDLQIKDRSYSHANDLFSKVPVARYTAEPMDATKPAWTSWCYRKVVTLTLHFGRSLWCRYMKNIWYIQWYIMLWYDMI